jgi:hypothetical protein
MYTHSSHIIHRAGKIKNRRSQSGDPEKKRSCQKNPGYRQKNRQKNKSPGKHPGPLPGKKADFTFICKLKN